MSEDQHLNKPLPTNARDPVGDKQSSLTLGNHGPIPLQRWQQADKLAQQKGERIPERAVHGNGWGAHGVLRITGDISHLTCAQVLQPGTETPVIARFSTRAGELGAAEHERGVRGFELRLFTKEGNWDLIGSNTPVFFIRDPLKFPDFIRAQKCHPRTSLRSRTAMWDFWSQSPESLHQLTIQFSDRGFPVSPMHMNGYGGHTYSLWNHQGERVWVKFHFKTCQGHRHVTHAEAEAIAGRTRETCQTALSGAITAGQFPRWTLQVQIMTQEQAAATAFDPFELTKVWPHKAFPPVEIGVLELNRNPQNDFDEVQQPAFCPSNLVRGIGHSPDRMLPGRISGDADAHRYRLGTFYQPLPMNRDHKDGAMRLSGGPPDPDVSRHDQRQGNDDFCQPRALFALFDSGQKARLHANLAAAMYGVPDPIIERQIGLFSQVHPHYGGGVCAALDAIDPAF